MLSWKQTRQRALGWGLAEHRKRRGWLRALWLTCVPRPETVRRFPRCCSAMAAMLAGIDGSEGSAGPTPTRSRVGVSKDASLFAKWLWSVAHGVEASDGAPRDDPSGDAPTPGRLSAPARLSLSELAAIHVHDVGSGAPSRGVQDGSTATTASANAPSRRAVVAMLKWLCAWVPTMPQPVLRYAAPLHSPPAASGGGACTPELSCSYHCMRSSRGHRDVLLVVRGFRWKHRDVVVEFTTLAHSRLSHASEQTSAQGADGVSSPDASKGGVGLCTADAAVQDEVLRIVASFGRTGNVPRAVTEARMFRAAVWRDHMVPVRQCRGSTRPSHAFPLPALLC